MLCPHFITHKAAAPQSSFGRGACGGLAWDVRNAAFSAIMSSTNNGHLVISPRAPDAALRRRAPGEREKRMKRNGKMPSNKKPF